MLGEIENKSQALGLGTVSVGTFLAIHSLLTAAWMEAAGGALISIMGVALMVSEQEPSRRRKATPLPPRERDQDPKETFDSVRPSLDSLREGWEKLYAFQYSGAPQQLAKMFRAAECSIAEELEKEEKIDWDGQLQQFEELRSKKRFETVLKKAQNGQSDLWEGLKTWVHWDPKIGKTIKEIEELQDESRI